MRILVVLGILFSLNIGFVHSASADVCVSAIKKAVKSKLKKDFEESELVFTKIVVDNVTGQYGESTYDYIVDVLNRNECVVSYSVYARVLPHVGRSEPYCRVGKISKIKCY